jgi:hypothetical protein
VSGVNLTTQWNIPTVVAVAPTETVVLQLDSTLLRGARRAIVQVENMDLAQTFSGSIWRRLRGMPGYAQATLPDYLSVTAGQNVCVDLDIEGSDFVQVRGVMSGAGGNVRIAANRKAATP